MSTSAVECEIMADPALEALLLQLTVSDTAQIKAAEKQIKDFLKKPSCVPSFVSQMQHSPHPHVRQMAAVLLRKKINSHWIKLQPSDHAVIKQVLLGCLGAEPEALVRHSLAVLIAAVCKHQIPMGQWNEVLVFVQQCTQHAEDDHRCLGMMMLKLLTETIGQHLQSQFADLRAVYLHALQEGTSAKVRVAALKAASAMVEFLSDESEVVNFRDLIVPMLSAVKLCVDNGDDQEAIEAFEVFGELVQSPTPIITHSLAPLVQYLLALVIDQGKEVRLRDSAGMLLNLIVTYKHKTVGKKTLAPAIIAHMLHLCAQTTASPGEETTNPEEQDEDEDEDDVMLFRIAQTLLDTMALSVSTKYVWGPMLQQATEYMSSQTDAKRRRAGLIALGLVAEGCEANARDQLPQVLPIILQAAQDPEPVVREAACFCVGQFSEHLKPDIIDNHHQHVLPTIFSLTEDPSKRVRTWSCYVLSEYAENLQPDQILPYLTPLMERLVQLLQSGTQSVQESAISAISATATGAEAAFVPFFPQVVAMLRPLLLLVDEQHMNLRGRAIECFGQMAIAVGADVFEPHLMDSMQHAVLGVQLDSCDLKEFTYSFFCNLAKTFKERFAPFLPDLVPHLLEAANISDSQIAHHEGADDEEDALASESDSDADSEKYIEVRVRTAMLGVKAGAIEALGYLAEHTGAVFLPMVEPVAAMLKKNHDYFHEKVRRYVITALPQMVEVTFAAHPAQWAKGMASPALEPLCAQVTTLAVETLVEHMQADADREAVARCCEGMQKIVELVGPGSLPAPMLNKACENTLRLLQEKARCQSIEEDSDDEEDGGDHDIVLMDAVADLVGSYAKVFGGGFAPMFEKFLPALLRFMKGHRPSTDRSMAIGAIAEVCEELGDQCAPFVDGLFDHVMRALADECINVRRNSAFCVGVLCQYGGATAVPRYGHFLTGLRPLFEASSAGDDGSCMDNACAAVARMIIVAPDALPLDQVLPVLLGALPLKADMTENMTVSSFLCGTLRRPEMQPHLSQAVQILAHMCSADYEVDDEVRAQITTTMKPLCVEFGAQLTPLFASWPPAHQQVAASWQQ